MKTRLFLSIIATAMLTACEKEVTMTSVHEPEMTSTVSVITEKENEVEFKCFVETGTTTRTTMSSDPDAFSRYSLAWQSNDAISIYDGTNTAVFKTNDKDVSDATFHKVSGNLKEDASTFIAFYPSTITRSNQVLPAVQHYVEGNVEQFPMYAVSSNHELHFKNLCGIFRISLKAKAGNDLKIAKISLFDDDLGLSGSFTIDENNTAVVTGNEGVTLTCTDAVTLSTYSTIDFNVVVPVGNYSSLKVKITDEAGQETILATTGSVNIKRSGIVSTEKTLDSSSFDSSLEYITITDTDVNMTYL